jgi:O-acetylhomoserine (thiol)-lyase
MDSDSNTPSNPGTDHNANSNAPALAFATEAVHSGLPRGHGVGVGLPIHNTTTFEFETLEDGAEIFQQGVGLSYSRVQNPTLAALETRLAALEGAQGAVVTATGQAATLLALITLARAGDHIVAASGLFGGSVGILGTVLPQFGIEATLASNDPTALAAALRPNSRAIFVETIGNPAGDVPDLAALAALAQAHNVALVVDNTWGAVGALCRPLAHGADVVVHSLTKWAAGHGTVLGGAVLARPGFAPSAPVFFEADREGKTLTERHGQSQSGAYLQRARYLGLQQMGMTLAPASAWQIMLGLESMALRIERECQSSQHLAEWLLTHPGVAWVSYAGLPHHPSHALAQRYLPHGAGAVLTFGVAGGLAGASAFFAKLALIRRAANLGDTRTLAVHPWTTTHGRLSETARAAAGVSPEMIRLSVGLEAVEDLKADLDQALRP